MRKIITVLFAMFLLVSCGKVEFSEEWLLDNYDPTTKTMDLSEKKLDSVPNFGKYLTGAILSELEVIDLSNNKLQITSKARFDVFTNVKKIDLSYNDFRFGGDFDLNTSIEELDLSNNSLINLEGIEKYKNLKRLDVSSNQLEDKAFAIKGLTKLEYLGVEGNNISEELKLKIGKLNK